MSRSFVTGQSPRQWGCQSTSGSWGCLRHVCGNVSLNTVIYMYFQNRRKSLEVEHLLENTYFKGLIAD